MPIKTKEFISTNLIYLNVDTTNNFHGKSEIELKFQDHICIFSPSSPPIVSSTSSGAGACGGGGGGGG